MRQADQVVWDWSGLRPSPTVLGLVLFNVAAFVVQRILALSVWPGVERDLALVPAEIFAGRIWQLATSVMMHGGVDHLVFNMLTLWIFGVQLEREVGGRAVLVSYSVGGLIGSLAVVAVAVLGLAVGPLGGILDLWHQPVVGASGACLAVTFHWLARHYYEVMNFLFIGPVRGRTLMLVMFVIELLRMISPDGVAWGAHMGGMGAGLVFGFGWYSPTWWRTNLKRRQLRARGRAIEEQLRVLEGGKSDPPKNKAQGRQRGDDWVN